MPETNYHILVLRFSSMGDVAMTVPVLRALKTQHPELKITVVTRPFFKPLFRGISGLEVFEVDFDSQYKGIFGLYKLSKTLRALKPNAVADLHNVLRTKVLRFFLLGLKFKQIDKGRSAKKALISGLTSKPLKNTHQRYADVFKALGKSVNLDAPKFPEPVLLSNITVNLIGSETDKWIGIAPFAKYPSKIYPISLLEQVIKNLSEQHKVLLFGSDQEVNRLQNIQEKYRNTVVIAGKLNLNEQMDVISNLDVMLSMDSANGHIAAMLGVKVITIWGVTHPNAGFTPFNQPKEHQLLANQIQYPQIPTSVYGDKYPEAYKNAAGSISPQEVVKTVLRAL